MNRSPLGFTLGELIVAETVLVALALIVPALFVSSLNRSRVAEAERTVHSIRQAIVRFHDDTGVWPSWGSAVSADRGEADIQVLHGHGAVPVFSTDAGWTGSVRDTFTNQLHLDRPGYQANVGALWRGPYLPAEVGPDPWRNQYLANVGVATRDDDSAVWVLSAGPNGIVETPYRQATDEESLGGDDIRVRVR